MAKIAALQEPFCGPALNTTYWQVEPISDNPSMNGQNSGTAVVSNGGSGGNGPLVQETSNSATGKTLTLTFDAAVTAGNSVVVAVAGYYDGTVTDIALGTSSDQFEHVGGAGGTGGNNAGIFAAYDVAGGTTKLTIIASAAGILAWAYEVTGAVVAVDETAGDYGSSGKAWSSGATGQTAGYQHFVVGVAAVIDNAGSITGPATWTNGTAYQNVVGANSYSVGGVSGYLAPSTPGSYTYSGTSASSSAWGAFTVAFLVSPTGSTQPGWGGYLFDEHPAYTGVSATFTIPEVSGGQYDSVWVGLGNVYQVGLYQTYDTSQPGNSSTRPWSWWLPGSGEQWRASAYPTSAGDLITLAMELTDDSWLMTITNNTQGWTVTERKSVLAVNIGSINNNGAGTAFWPYPVRTAEVIIEREDVELPNYTSLTFTGITTTPPVSEAPSPIFTVNETVDQYPGSYSEGSFTMIWHGYS